MAERRKYKKRYCKYCEAKVDFMDYKDAGSLRFSLSERYKIMPRRLTGNCKRHQEMVTIAIKHIKLTKIDLNLFIDKEVLNNPFENIK